MKVLVTGAGGFVGARLVTAALAAGHDVTALHRKDGAAPPVSWAKAHLAYADLSDREATAKLLEVTKPQAILHAAARIPARAGEDAFRFLDDNVRATLHLLYGAREAGVEGFVFSSSMSVYGDPTYLPVDERHPTVPASAYGISKLEGEMYTRLIAEEKGPRATVLRYSGVFGPGQKSGAIPTFIARCLKNEPLTLHAGGRPSSDYVWVDDVARANLLALERRGSEPFAVYNVGSGREIRVAELAELVRNACGSSSDIQKTEIASAREFRFAYNVSKAGAELGFAPTPLESAIGLWVTERKAHREGA